MTGTPTLAIGLDVGGTKILGAVVARDGTIVTQDVVPTPVDPVAVMPALTAMTRAMQQHAPAGSPVGIGYPALITRDGVARYGPNISTRELSLRDELARAVDADVTADNDATCATWAEFVVGAGRGAGRDMVMFTLGTGIGGGVVVDGRIVRGANGFAGELGHLVIEARGRPGRSGILGEVEAYSSGSAFGALIAEAVRSGAFAGTPLEGHDLPTPGQVEAAARDGVAPALSIITTMGWHLGLAMAGMVNALDPDLIVVGGGAARGGDLILDPARASLREHTLGVGHRPDVPVVPAELGPEAGVIGAGLLALDAAG